VLLLFVTGVRSDKLGLPHARMLPLPAVRRRPAPLHANQNACRVLLRSGDYTKAEIAAELAVGRHTLWRHLLAESEK
jgi:DNA-binding CsgD family transcriptional regulator